jgi:hypothetical protein
MAEWSFFKSLSLVPIEHFVPNIRILIYFFFIFHLNPDRTKITFVDGRPHCTVGGYGSIPCM